MKQRFQINLKTLLLVVSLCAVALFMSEVLFVENALRNGGELVVIQVINKANGLPIQNAVLQSSDLENEPAPKTTNKHGEVGFLHSYEFKHLKSLLRNRYLRVVEHSIEINADGFHPIEVDIESYRMTEKDKFRVPHPITVELIRVAN